MNENQLSNEARGDEAFVDPALLELDELLEGAPAARGTASFQRWHEAAAEALRSSASLGAAEREHLESSAALFAALDAQKVTVGSDFTETVLQQVQSRRAAPASWRSMAAAAVAAAVLLTFSLLVFGRSGQEGVAATLADLAWSSVTVGAGLLNVSWKGVATLVSSWFETSPFSLFGACAALVGAQLFLWRRLRAGDPEAAAATQQDR